MRTPIAIVGMACRYPEADTVEELVENALAQRRAFREMPPERLPAEYFGTSPSAVDRSYSRQAALIKGFRFDREWFRVGRQSYEVTDLTHWLALTVAKEAIDDVSFRAGARHVNNEAVRVVVANTLSGEFSRAGLMRLRWPYVRRIVAQHLRDEDPGISDDDLGRRLRELETQYKQPFPVPNEDFLSGGLANTIAGRICNHFDFKGGGYTVDGACASSLLAVSDACSALVAGDADMVLAGGVDLSLDPFELVGFSRSAALAKNEMRVYDERSEGFWPGEGCGFVALMRADDAVEQCERVHAVIHGWGISSDGRGGLTRPESGGQQLALRRCYTRAGYGIESVGYFEGHGTGTEVGDAAELRALITARRDAGKPAVPAVISSIKANIGHTKAAAGLAGLLRAALCVREHVLPPTTACGRPHELVANADDLVTSYRPQVWTDGDVPRRAGVSAMGFGGINTHVTIEEVPLPVRRCIAMPDSAHLRHLSACQDAELFLFAATTRSDLNWTIDRLAGIVGQCSRSELTDLAVELARRATRDMLPIWKAAVVAATPGELRDRLERLREQLARSPDDVIHVAADDGVFLSGGNPRGAVGLIFPGQGAPARPNGGVHARRFEDVDDIYALVGLGSVPDHSGTDFAQPAIVAASVGGLRMLERIGADGDIAIGHSLGELTALHWAGCFDAESLFDIARARGRAMVDDETTRGAMAAIAADRERTVAAIAGCETIVVANCNAPRQTVISGRREEVEALVSALRRERIGATVLGIDQAFHSPAMAGVAATFGGMLRDVAFAPARRTVISTVTGEVLETQIDLVDHLCHQLLAPVQFLSAARRAARNVDLFVEVGPGHLMEDLVRSFIDRPVISIDVGGESLEPFLRAAGAIYVLGRAPEIACMFTDRFARRFDWDWKPKFFQNPCELLPTAPLPTGDLDVKPDLGGSVRRQPDELDSEASLSDELRQIIADHTGLPAWSFEDSSRMSSELHLNSITVSDIVIRLAVARGLSTPVDPSEYADASISEIAAAVESLAQMGTAPGSDDGASARGVGAWVRHFEVVPVFAPPREPADSSKPGLWEAVGATPPYANELLQRLNTGRCGSGVIVWLGDDPGPDDLVALLSAAQRCIGRPHDARISGRLVVLQRGWGAGGFARSFFLEQRSVDVLVINLPAQDDHRTVGWILSEIGGAHAGFREVSIDSTGCRHEPRVRLLEEPVGATRAFLDDSDVVLVTGGAKGISAECGFQLALRTGCALLVLGRSSPDDDEVAHNLERFGNAGVRVKHEVADVTDPAAVAAAVKDGITVLGAPVTGVVHGAGSNRPRSVSNMMIADLESTLAPKLAGLRNVLAAVDPRRLKLLSTFSSIIARIGLRGEADYALSNEWLSHETEEFQRRYPACRCRAIEWSVWSGAGMGQRLGRLDILERQGISPISVDDGVREFLRLIETPGLPTRVLVSGRFGEPHTIVRDRVARRRFRFLDSVLVDYPGIELISECELSAESDPYLDDHVLAGERLFPAVMSLEAMTEAVAALVGRETATLAVQFRDVAFRAPIVVPPGDTDKVTIRVAALADRAPAQAEREISLAIRCSATNFQINHVEARCRLRQSPSLGEAAIPHLPVDDIGLFNPNASLYDNVLFQRGRFRRVESYQLLEARRCSGRLSADGATQWFARDLPQGLVLGDAGARDAALHAIQACIPHRVVIPFAVGQIDTTMLDPSCPYRMYATEIADHGDELVYDLTILGSDGVPVERWRRIVLRVVRSTLDLRIDSPQLMAPMFERRVAASIPQAKMIVSVESTDAEQRLLKGSGGSDHRPDGRPDSSNGSRFRSASYSGAWRLTVDAGVPVGCDLESVAHREDDGWALLLGEEGLQLAGVVGGLVAERLDVSATRVWTVREAMKKAGLPATAPLVADAASTRDWAVFRSGDATVFSSMIDAPRDGAQICIAAALVTARH